MTQSAQSARIDENTTRQARALLSEVKRIGAIPMEQRTPAELKILGPKSTSKRFKIFRGVVGGIIGVATGGAALTALGVIGPGAAAAGAAVPASAVPGAIPVSVGMTAQAGLPAYSAQLAAASKVTASATTLKGIGATVAGGIKAGAEVTSTALAIKSAFGGAPAIPDIPSAMIEPSAFDASADSGNTNESPQIIVGGNDSQSVPSGLYLALAVGALLFAMKG